MPGIRGEDDEQPANRRAGRQDTYVSRFGLVELSCGERSVGVGGLQSNIMEMAMRIMRTWWYPSTGISPGPSHVSFLVLRHGWSEECEVLCMPTAKRMFAIATAFLCFLHYKTPVPPVSLRSSSFREGSCDPLCASVLGDTYDIQVSQFAARGGS